MRRNITALPVGSTSADGLGLGSILRAIGARSVRPSAGSSARPAGGRLCVLFVATVLIALFVSTSSAGAKFVVDGYGTTGTLGGQFSASPPEFANGGGATGLGVNNTGAGGVAPGTFYVVDAGSEGRRVTRFSSSGEFERTWGRDVIQAGKPGDISPTAFEICTVAADCKPGTFVNTENGGFVNSSASNNGLAVSQLTGHVYIEDRANRITQYDADGNFIRLWGWDVVMSGKPNDKGTNAFEICDTTAGNVPADCKNGESGFGVGKIGGQETVPEVDSDGNVWVPDDFSDRLVQFSPTGEILKVVGAGVISDGAEGTGAITEGLTTVSSVVAMKRYFLTGQRITGEGIQPETRITAVGATTLTLSKPATQTGSRTLTAPEGAGNVVSNERQTVSFVGTPTEGAFALTFDGSSTGGMGDGDVIADSNVLTDVHTTAGAFQVGQLITGNVNGAGFEKAFPPGTTITAVGPNTITLSKTLQAPLANALLRSYDLPYNAPAAQVQASLNGLPSIGGVGGSVSVSGPAGGPYVVDFGGPKFAGADVPSLIGANLAGLTPSVGVGVSAENLAIETCTVLDDCRAGIQGSAPSQTGNEVKRMTFDSAGNTYVIDRGNARVIKFNPSMTSASVFAKPTLNAFTKRAPEAIAAVGGGNRIVVAIYNTVSANPPERQIVELDLSGALKDVSLQGQRLDRLPANSGNNINELDENPSTGTLYAAISNVPEAVPDDAARSPRHILALRSSPPEDPVIAIDPITVKADTTATFSGTVDPMGGLAECAFEYSEDQSTWDKVTVEDCKSLEQSGGDQPISQTVTGLISNTHYFVRLALERPLVSNSTTTTPTQEFDTDEVPPVVDNVSPLTVQDISVRLAIRIDPRHSQTSYAIHYGTTPGLGSMTEPIELGSGSSPQLVTVTMGELFPSTKYFYKVVATNGGGSGESAVQSLTTRAVPFPSPSDRRYEMVSPIEKGFAPIDNVLKNYIGPNATVAEDGNALSFCTGSIFGPDPASYGLPGCGWNVMQRTDAGWTNRSVLPPICVFDHGSAQAGIPLTNVVGFDSNVDNAVFFRPEVDTCPIGPLDPNAPSPQSNMYFTNLEGETRSYELLTTDFQFNKTYGGLSGSMEAAFYGGSSDFSHAVFTSSAKLTPDAPEGEVQKIYDWHEGEPHLVSIDPLGVPFPAENPFLDRVTPVTNAWAHHGISTDGTKILFARQIPVFGGTFCFTFPISNNCNIYMRVDNAVTYEVSKSECSSGECPGGGGAAFFKRGTPDLSSVFFGSRLRLTNDADETLGGEDIFRFRLHGNEDPASDPSNLTLLTKDNEPADGTEASAETVLGVTNDGNTAIFVAEGQIVAGASTEPGHKIYRWQWNGGSPTIEYLFMLPPEGREQALNWYRPNGEQSFGVFVQQGSPPNRETTMARLVSQDGKYVLIQSFSRLVPGVDYDSHVDYYRWGEGEGLVCVSCQAPGSPSNGPSFTGLASTPGSFQAGASAQPRQASMSVDGQKIFFQSRDALVASDENGTVQDVYEWNEGTLSLISSGRSATDSYLIGVSRTADDVFFVTEDRFVGWDTDDLKDVYDARVEGGFPEPPLIGAPCEGEACRGAGSPTGAISTAGSAVFEGAGNERTRSLRCRKGFKKKFVRGREVCRRARKSRRRSAAQRQNWKKHFHNGSGQIGAVQ